MKRYIIIAGETSGDNYGSQLIKSIGEIHPDDVEFWGVGGEKMVSAGLNELENINNISVVGFSEVIKKLPHLIQLRNRLSLFINELQPEHIILIDYPGFNLNLVKRIEKKITPPIITPNRPRVVSTCKISFINSIISLYWNNFIIYS